MTLRNSLLLLAATLAGCASHPAATERAEAIAAAPVVAAAAPAIAALPAPNLAPEPPAALEPAPLSIVATPTLASDPAITSAPQYSDLLARLRAGFKLGENDSAKIDRELNWYAGHPDYIERVFARAELYLHHIVTEVEARGLPLEIALLPVIESAFEPYAYSRARASGLWQFIPGTGTRFGLKQDWWYDGRRDIVASTRAALDYLEFLQNEFNGDWLLAVAAYNCGEMTVARAVRSNLAAGKPIDFWSLKLPAETRAYVPKLLAMSRLVAKPEAFGLSFSSIPNVAYFRRVDTGGPVDLQIAAELAGITREELYELNPAHHRWATDPSGPHVLLLPVEIADPFTQALQTLTADERLGVVRYTVKKGDTVNSVAQRFKTNTQVVRDLNELPATARVTVGDELRVPSTVSQLPPKVLRAAALVDGRRPAVTRRPKGVHVVRNGDSLWGIARLNGMDVGTLASLNGLKPGDMIRAGQRLKTANLARSGGGASARVATSDNTAAPSIDARQVTYVVRKGDTLWSIAKLLQVTLPSLLAWNELATSATIQPGQKLVAFVRRRS